VPSNQPFWGLFYSSGRRINHGEGLQVIVVTILNAEVIIAKLLFVFRASGKPAFDPLVPIG
jgi:hypothetical protein